MNARGWSAWSGTIVTRVIVIVSLFVAIILFLLSLVLAEMDRIEAIRACVKAEGFWSQAQKEAARHLDHYTSSRQEAEYQNYLQSIQVPLGVRQARVELMKRVPDMKIVQQGLVQGRNSLDDAKAIAGFFLESRNNPYHQRVVEAWIAGDELIAKLQLLAQSIRQGVVSGKATANEIEGYRTQLHLLDDQLNEVEDRFSIALGDTSRFAMRASRDFVYGSAVLLALLGTLLSWLIVVRIRANEQQSHENAEKLRAITSSAQDAVIIVDKLGQISFWNEAAEKIFGYRREEALGRELHHLLAPQRYRPNYTKGAHHFQATGDGSMVGKTLELSARHRDGHEFPIELSLSGVQVTDGWNAIGIVRDISERKRTEKEIRKLNDELEQKVEERTRELVATQDELVRKEKLAVLGVVAGSVGHELRNPLGVINNAVYFLQNVIPNTEQTVHDYLEMIKAEVGHAEHIVSELLDAVRTKPPRIVPVTASELIDMSVRHCAIPATVDLNLDLSAANLLAVDPEQMQQVFCNLISNGIEAMPQGGILQIGVKSEDTDAVTITVKDTGIGIKPEDQAKLFQPLFTTKTRGIGLGLVVVKNLVRANGGTIAMDSTPGEGTCFSVRLPTDTAIKERRSA